MRITGGRPMVVNATPKTNWIFVLLETDEGITGIGESTLGGEEVLVVKVIEQMVQSLIGTDPLKSPALTPSHSQGRVAAAARSGIDQALWDIKGKAYGVPICQLLRSVEHEVIPVYANINRGTSDRSPAGFGRRAELAVKEGFDAVKCAPFDDTWWWEATRIRIPLEEGAKRVEAVRASVGGEINLLVDCHWRFDVPTAICAARRLELCDLFWYEAPVAEKDPMAVREVKTETGMRIAGGELQISTAQYAALIRVKALDVLMPDVKYIGGITGLLDAGAVAEAFGLAIAPHNPSGPVATAATLHAAAAIRNLMIVEYPFAEVDWYDDLAGTDFRPRDGVVTPPSGPGLGITFNLPLAEKHPYVAAPAFLHPRLHF